MLDAKGGRLETDLAEKRKAERTVGVRFSHNSENDLVILADELLGTLGEARSKPLPKPFTLARRTFFLNSASLTSASALTTPWDHR